MPLSRAPPLNEPVDLRKLLRTGLKTKPDEIALVSAEGGHTWRALDRARDGGLQLARKPTVMKE